MGDLEPARRALARLIGADRADQLNLERVSGTADHFTISGLTVAGTTPAVVLTGCNWYLKYVAGAGITWNGDAIDLLPTTLPATRTAVTKTVRVRHRFAINDVMPAYTGPYWSWSDWERQIDVLAANGINEMLVYPGAATIYYELFQQFGYTGAELRQWIGQPTHHPWWLMQNMAGFGGPISEELLDAHARLGQRILSRLRDLEIAPVLPGYFGTVPPDFAARNPGALVIAQGWWNGLRRPDWLDPRDRYFGAIAQQFYRTQQRLFGTAWFYRMDPLQEGGTAGDMPIGEAMKAIQVALDMAHPAATWMTLAWQRNPRAEHLAAVDTSRLLILDGHSDRYPGLDRELDWGATPYCYGTIWNFGGHTALGANLTTWGREFPEWLGRGALDGIALMPEANDNNPAAMAFFTELAWSETDPTTWIRDYSAWRYGGPDPHARAAWEILLRTAYAMPMDGWAEAPDGLFGARPSLSATRAAQFSPQGLRYDAAEFVGALPELLAIHPGLRESSAYRYDLVEVARQVLANQSRKMLPEIAAAYDAADLPEFLALCRSWLHAMELLDELLATDPHFLLGRWLRRARAAGAEFSARTLLTGWASRSAADSGLHDYANREWHGLVGGLYLPRWRRYFATLEHSLRTKTAPERIDWPEIDEEWARGGELYPTEPIGDSYDLASRVYQLTMRAAAV
jgi:alpha-N-acetylglucosaminidase